MKLVDALTLSLVERNTLMKLKELHDQRETGQTARGIGSATILLIEYLKAIGHVEVAESYEKLLYGQLTDKIADTFKDNVEKTFFDPHYSQPLTSGGLFRGIPSTCTHNCVTYSECKRRPTCRENEGRK